MVTVWYGNEVSKHTDPSTWGWRVLRNKVTNEEASKLKIEYEKKGYKVSFQKAW